MSSSSRKFPNRWTEEEDSILHEQVMKHYGAGEVKDWNRIADQLPGRTNKDCRKRWINQVCGGLRKGSWKEDEDKRLLDAMSIHGQKWTLVANSVGSRSADQCAKRWQHSLDPNLERGNWTAEEDEKLLKYVRKYGREWKRIQQDHYAKRSRNDLKNRYTILSRKLENITASSSGSQAEGTSSPGSHLSSPMQMHETEDDNLSIDTDLESYQISSKRLSVDNTAEISSNAHRWKKRFSTQAATSISDQMSIANSYDDSSLLQFLHVPEHADQIQRTPGHTISQITSSRRSETDQEWIDATLQDFTNRDATTGFSSQYPPLDGLGVSLDLGNDLFSSPGYSAHDSNGFGLDRVSSKLGPSMGANSVASVVLRVERCNWDTLKYLIDVTKPIKDHIKMEIKHCD
ncbi:putative myb transcription protein [Rosellinia necatrix]|uniref:Putative myb transcription protein n=1 Tax=Rosellinia necatrix TaxID=77044 RepID=A0A1S7UHL9_ROSNE|nr:putative myb transcription protein [Rosellinia necatrix]